VLGTFASASANLAWGAVDMFAWRPCGSGSGCCIGMNLAVGVPCLDSGAVPWLDGGAAMAWVVYSACL
jgi:hypothetical protein